MKQGTRMPVLFIGHGSPMNAIEDTEFSQAWSDVARRIPKPDAALCVSAHWETRGVRVSAAEHPHTIHDFYGFPDELYAVRYAAPGAPELAAEVAALARSAAVLPDGGMGLDHGAWSVLRRMYPKADVPVVQLSLDTSQPGVFHHSLGRELRSLREKKVLVLGSGNIVHNLRMYNYHKQAPYPWALTFDDAVVRLVEQRRHDALMDYRALPDAKLAIPTPEHYLPLLYALGLRDEDEQPDIFCRTTLRSISMTCIAFGLGDER